MFNPAAEETPTMRPLQGDAGADATTSSPAARPITGIIRQQFSCRTYEERPIGVRERRALAAVLAANRVGPLGSRARFALVAANEEDRSSLKGLGTYGFIKGATGFKISSS